MIHKVSIAAVCATAAVTLSAQPLPDVLRPDHVAGESKHVCACAQARLSSAHASPHAHALVDKPSKVQRRNYDVLRYDLEMDWRNPLSAEGTGFDDRRYTGRNRITVRIDSAGVAALRLNAAMMTIDSVVVTPQRSVLIGQPEDEEWTLAFDTPFQAGDTVVLDVFYTSGTIFNRGFHLYPQGFGTEQLPDGSPAVVEERLAYTMSEPYYARYWMPCNDLPYDKAMTSIAVRVPVPFTVASNGLLQDVRDEQDGSRTYSWKSFSPMPTYLMVAVASVYKEFGEWYHRRDNPADSIPVLYYVWQKDFDAEKTDRTEYNARHSFRNTVRMMETYSDLFVEYPFEKYGMAAIQPFTYGGMEHQTMSTINRRWMLYYDEYGIAHELMHQWTGNLVTCATFADIWLNEGGATHGEALWAEELGGNDLYMQVMLAKRNHYLSDDNNEGPIYAPTNIFNYATSYAKAGWVYHMLRRMLGDETYFAAMKAYFAEFADRSIETEDMVALFEREVPNPPVPFRTFFDQWIYGARHPVYNVSYSVRPHDGTGYPVTVTVEQTQSGPNVPDVFVMPMKLTLRGQNGEREVVEFLNDGRVQEVAARASFPVVSVALNEEHDVLAEVGEAVVGVAEHPSGVRVVPAPNPAVRGGAFTLDLEVLNTGPVEIVLVNMLGVPVQTLYSGSLSSGVYRITNDVPDVAPGMYFLRIVKDDTLDVVKIGISE